MTPEEVWRGKSDEELVAASQRLSDYTDVGQRVIVAELDRRRESDVMTEPVPCAEAPDVDDPTGTSDSGVDVPHSYLRRLWCGHISLPITYWIWGVVANFAWRILIALAAATNVPTLLLFLVGLHLVYSVFVCVAIWRSSGRYKGKRIWAELARISLAAGIAGMVVSVLFGP